MFRPLIPIRPVNRRQPVRRMNTLINISPPFAHTILITIIIIISNSNSFLKLSLGVPIESERTTNNCWISPRSYPIRIVLNKSMFSNSSPIVTKPSRSLPKRHRNKQRAWFVCHISKMDSIFECFPVNMNTIQNASHAGLQWILHVQSVGETIFSLLAHRLAHIVLRLDRERWRENFSFVCNSKNLLFFLCEYFSHVLIEGGKQWLSVASVFVLSSYLNTRTHFWSSFSTNSLICLYVSICMYVWEVSVVRESTISYIILGHYVFFLFSSGVSGRFFSLCLKRRAKVIDITFFSLSLSLSPPPPPLRSY